jgi:hypothetical protein
LLPQIFALKSWELWILPERFVFRCVFLVLARGASNDEILTNRLNLAPIFSVAATMPPKTHIRKNQSTKTENLKIKM